MKKKFVIALVAAFALSLAGAAQAGNPSRDKILSDLKAQAGGDFSAQRGQTLFQSKFTGGKEDTPSCTSCHGNSPQTIGQTRAGKPIDPMAVSRTADRYTDIEKVEKWFGRNCNSVLGRACTAQEKGDFITFMSQQ